MVQGWGNSVLYSRSHQVEMEVSAKLLFSSGAQGPSQVHLGCWQNSVPCDHRTEALISRGHLCPQTVRKLSAFLLEAFLESTDHSVFL